MGGIKTKPRNHFFRRREPLTFNGPWPEVTDLKPAIWPLWMVTLIAFVFFFGCNGANQMNKIESMWESLIASESESQEREIIEQVSTYMAGKRIHVNVRAVTAQGKEIELDKIAEASGIIIRATFKEGGASYQAPDWMPRDNQNVYILFRE